jgi:hypothetical protein
MHTHAYDGSVHTVNLNETVYFDNLNQNSGVEETIPVIIGLDGGTPTSSYANANYTQLTLLDGGQIGD